MSKTEQTLIDRLNDERKQTYPSKAEFMRTVEMMIAEIEADFLERAMGLSADHNLDDVPAEAFESQLDPQIPFEEKIIAGALQKLPDRELSAAAETALYWWKKGIRAVHFRAGVLMGLRLRGASKEELDRVIAHWCNAATEQ